ncbi:TolC family protein [Altererythrobacter sp. RZ02]|uniref:TolC family protein n=1 Tax=Pontixanthobacter rizhaonensis TaxID=2730337 RepID=A0A848QQ68_9SPHN|nr:TolC family protein [Pontixanthobacter rizhaonensis]NMW31268.1 TolC family protein [Pontixanthobacter rizhaonensis]
MNRNRFCSHLLLAIAAPLTASCASTASDAVPRSAGIADEYSPSFQRSFATVVPAPPVNRWWATLDDPTLTSLIDAGLANSPEVSIALARVDRSLAFAAEQRANRMPTVSGSAIAIESPISRDRPFAGNQQGVETTGSDNDYYNLGINTSWEVDLFGARANNARAALAETEVARAELADVHVSLAAQIATAYVAYRRVQNETATLQLVLDLQQEKLSLQRTRVQYGTASDAILHQMNGEIAQVKATLSAAEAEKIATADQIALLTGNVPGSLDVDLMPVRSIPLPPIEVSVGNPASLLQRRPDIRSAESALQAANARIGVANAQRFPSVSFFGVLGLGGSEIGDTLDTGNLSALLLPRINWSFLDFGRVNARIAQADSGAVEAAANYDRAVLNALSEAEQSLTRFGGQRQRVLELAVSSKAARDAEELVAVRLRGGTATRISVIDSTLQRLEAQTAQLTATADMVTSFVSVQKSLGLGWSEPDEGG